MSSIFDHRYIVMYPTGKMCDDNVSLYLCLAANDRLEPGWFRAVQLVLRIHNPEDERTELFKGMITYMGAFFC